MGYEVWVMGYGGGGCSSAGRTICFLAPAQDVAYAKNTIAVLAPALELCVVLQQGGKACLFIRKHDHFTPTREIW